MSTVDTRTVQPADLQPGDLIPTDLCGTLTVIASPFIDHDDDDPVWDRVYVDVEPADQSLRWDVDLLAEAAGAEAFQLLGVRPQRYRLTYLPDADVEVAV